eukprot:gnl/TRDRNA2_/TRDRNA2_144551_c1_seq2.p1 gnl/TRDRNA2_/TRDRNA2_144551_c1~~gnl/TRDRNA2_/TRDRNA2_144551_c1_seq2.p1  ORF type:complete len:737 (-),score=122.61 gnl/TRDRNA2_/TRDRNA2_144551_c1_seq2:76-2196(-)
MVQTAWLASSSLLPLPEPVASGGIIGPHQVVAWQAEELFVQVPPAWVQLRGPVGTVCIAGDDRIGKSTLLTLWGRNLTQSEGFTFSMGGNHTSHTQGMWSAVLPAELTGLDYHVNLCDSQGLKQISGLKQWRLFSANVLVPTALVYMVYNVVQKDQLRDLAEMAHQFKTLSSEDFPRFGRQLSPHLFVVVRDESALRDGDDDDDDLTAHLEKALSSEGAEEYSKLIREVFQTREAWALERLPKEAVRAMRKTGSVLEANSGIDDSDWRSSGEAIFARVLTVMGNRRKDFPKGGPELGEWLRSVVATANSQEPNSIGRLLGHSERVRDGPFGIWRRTLDEGRTIAFGLLAGAALLLTFGGVLERWLDRLAWLAWIAVCVCYFGTSPLVTAPLHGIVPKYCEELMRGTVGLMILRPLCNEVSALSAAILLAVVVGALSYPLLTAQLRYLLRLLPMPGFLRWAGRQSGAPLAMVVCAGRLGLFGEGLGAASMDSGSHWALGTGITLLVSTVVAAANLTSAANRNRTCVLLSETGRQLHFYMAAREAEIARLEMSREWKTHYRNHDKRDALWRHRLVSVWPAATVFTQAAALLAWAWLIFPGCDAVLMAGAICNSMHIAYVLVKSLLRVWRRRGCGEFVHVDEWMAGLDDAASDDEQDEPTGAHAAPLRSPAILPESEEEVEARHAIEEMRNLQEQPPSFFTLRWLRPPW